MSVTAFLKKLHEDALGETLRAATFEETNIRLDGWVIRKDAKPMTKSDLSKLLKALYDDKTERQMAELIAIAKGYTYTEGDAQIYALWNIKHYDNDQVLCFFVNHAGKWVICIGTDYSQATDLWYFKMEF